MEHEILIDSDMFLLYYRILICVLRMKGRVSNKQYGMVGLVETISLTCGSLLFSFRRC